MGTSNVPERYKRQNKIVPEFTVSTTVGSPDNIVIKGQDCDVWVTTGTVYIDAVNLATTTTGLLCTANTIVQLNIKDRLSLLAVGTAKVQILIYE